MRYRFGFVLASLLTFLWIASAWAQTGVVMGTVTDDEGNPIDSAYVTLSDGCGGGGGGGGGCQPDYATYTAEDGTYEFPEVDPDTYTAKARKMGVGKATEEIEVLAGQTLVVDFELTGCGGGGCPGDTLEVVDVEGWAIVDTVCQNRYYLDEDGDGEPEYRLQFGPPWYDPGSGATRPENGEWIEITGGLVDWVIPPMIIVYEINGLWWRDPVYPGGGHHGWGHRPDNGGKVARIQAAFPNPFNPETTVSFILPEAGQTSLSVYNLRGEKVAELFDGFRQAGIHQVTWNASSVSSGIYLLRLETGDYAAVKKVVFTK